MNQTIHPDITALLSIMTEDEISPLWAASDGMVRPHPLCELLANSEDPPPISLATIRSLRLASKSEPLWMKRLRARLLDAADFTNAGAALGEIRAYGAMTFAGLKPKPIDQGDNPDFRVEVGEKAIIVEVHTKQMDYTQQAKLGAWLDARKHSVPPPGVSVETSPSIAPFGEPDRSKPGDTVVANMISRLAGIKAREHQLHEGLANVLWLDLCSSPLGMLIDTGHALPFMSRMGRISSGALWYAAYGRRGLPIIEGRAHAHHVVVPMGHDGKFVGRSTKISGLIASCIDGFVLLRESEPHRRIASRVSQRPTYTYGLQVRTVGVRVGRRCRNRPTHFGGARVGTSSYRPNSQAAPFSISGLLRFTDTHPVA